jgi:hypothetical protein
MKARIVAGAWAAIAGTVAVLGLFLVLTALPAAAQDRPRAAAVASTPLVGASERAELLKNLAKARAVNMDPEVADALNAASATIASFKN